MLFPIIMFEKLLQVWIDGKDNPANIVSKHWTYPQVWHLLQPKRFYSGDTSPLIEQGKEDKQEKIDLQK
jgi:hypothetical protein